MGLTLGRFLEPLPLACDPRLKVSKGGGIGKGESTGDTGGNKESIRLMN